MKLRIKKLTAVGLVSMMILALTGCGDKVKLTEEQNDLIAEYIAGTMLKYSYDNEWDYTKLKVAQNTYVPKGTSSAAQNQKLTGSSNSASSMAGSTSTTKAGNTGNSSAIGNGTASANTNPLTSMPSSLGLTGVDITYKGCSVGKSYPIDEFAIAVPALSGYQVAAVEFELKNTTGSAMTLNTSAGSVSMKLTVSGNNVNQYTSLLKNDISGLKNISLAAGETYTAVAVFQVEESLAAQVSGSTLTITAGSTSLGTLTLK